jgi:hypothetical protein
VRRAGSGCGSDTGNRPEGSGVNGVGSSISTCRVYDAGVLNDGVCVTTNGKEQMSGKDQEGFAWWRFDALCGRWLLHMRGFELFYWWTTSSLSIRGVYSLETRHVCQVGVKSYRKSTKRKTRHCGFVFEN